MVSKRLVIEDLLAEDPPYTLGEMASHRRDPLIANGLSYRWSLSWENSQPYRESPFSPGNWWPWVPRGCVSEA